MFSDATGRDNGSSQSVSSMPWAAVKMRSSRATSPVAVANASGKDRVRRVAGLLAKRTIFPRHSVKIDSQYRAIALKTEVHCVYRETFRPMGSISGVPPPMMSEIIRPDPHAMVQPSVPWPVFR